jgi:phenylacetate-CoA ligase
VILDRRQDGKDYMTIRVERAREVERELDRELSQRIQKQIKDRLLVTAEVEIVDYGSLPRSERKSKRIFDNRPI